MAGAARRLHIRLFLEGMEVPVVGAQIRATLGGPAAAQIQIVPTDRGMEFLHGTLVHLFYLDTDDPGFDQTDTAVVVDDKDDAPPAVNRNSFYKLVFSGEVAGFHFMKNAGSRSLILQCLDTSKHWDTVYQFMLDYSTTADTDNSWLDNAANFTGSGTALVNMGPGLSATAQLSDMLVKGEPSTPGLEGARGLLGGLIKILEGIGGVRGSSRGINDYTTIAELMVKNMYQIGADQADDSALQLMDATVFQEQLTNTLQQLGGRVSLRDILRVINSYIYHDVAPNPAPYYTAGTAVSGFNTSSTLAFDHAATVTLKAPERLHPDLVEFWDRLQKLTPPAGVSSYNAGNSARSAADQSAAFRKGFSKARPGQSPHNYDKSLALDVYAIRDGEISNRASDYQQIGDLAVEMGLTWGGNWTSFVDKPHVQVTGWRRHIGSKKQVGSEKKAGMTGRPDGGDATLSVSADVVTDVTEADERATARLITQIFRPDVWYVPPPRCNVFFPENYASLSYSRNYLQEITRLQLRTGSELLGQTGMHRDYYYAPMIESLKKELEQNSQLRSIFLMPHEKFTGIIPEMQSVADIGFYLNDIIGETAGEAKHTFARQVAAFNFFKTRFSARALSVSGGYFTPFPVCGFPAVVIQRGLPPVPELPTSRVLQMINERSVDLERGFDIGGKRMYLPTQFVGMVESVDHSLSQNGGNTSLTLSHVRTHRAADGQDDEFLNHLIEGEAQETTPKEVVTLYETSNLLATENYAHLQIVAFFTPQGPDAVASKEVDKTFWPGSVGPQGGELVRVVTSGKFVKQDIIQQSRSANVGHNTRYYTMVRVIETIQEGPGDTRPPVETVLAPPWIADVYGNETIGDQVYQPFFGTGSIVDEQAFHNRRTTTAGDVSSRGSVVEEDVSGAAGDGVTSIAQAVDTLSTIYGSLKAQDAMDVHRFIHRYTYRPLASMDDVLGHPDFALDEDGNPVLAAGGNIAGFEGFHSRAISGLEELKGLLPRPEAELKSETAKGTAAIDPDMDPRRDRRKRVERYLSELTGVTGSKGLLG